jgi:exodeoxyribonuclease VII small subunit
MAKRKSAENPTESLPSFEDSLSELQTIVTELEDGALGLETSLARFERGIGLLRTCYSILEAAETRVEILTRFDSDDSPITAPFENTATMSPARERTEPAKNHEPEEDDASNSTQPNEDSAKSSLF